MRIGIIGAGMIGSTLAKPWVDRLRRIRPTFQLRAGGSRHSADDQRDVVVLIRSAEFLDFG